MAKCYIVRDLIDACGAISAVARILGHTNHTTVLGWVKRNNIPWWHVKAVRSIARRFNLNLEDYKCLSKQHRV